MFSSFTISKLRIVPGMLTVVLWVGLTATTNAQPIPDIIQQPQSQTILQGSNANFTVTASGQSPFTYQWWHNGSQLGDNSRVSGAQASQLNITDVVTNDAGDYTVTVFDRQGDSVTSSPATLTVATPPSFTLEPPNRDSFLHTDVNFPTAVAGEGPIGFQWWFNGAPLASGGRISGATTAVLVISGLETNDAGFYHLIATNTWGAASSRVAQLHVLVPVSITQQPESLSVVAGSNAQFTVAAAGDPPLTYRWQKGTWVLDEGGRFSGTRTPNLQIANVQPEDAGDYLCWVFGVGGEGSAPATLSVLVPPAFTNAPQGASIPVGDNFTLAAAATGTAPISYRWFFNNGPLADRGHITGADTSTLSLFAASTNDSGLYWLVASNVAGVTTSAVASVSVGSPPAIIQLPLSQTNATGSTAQMLSLAAGTEPLHFQWYFNNAPVVDDARRAGATTTNLTITSLLTGDSGNYALVAANAYGRATSAVAVLTVIQPPAITVQPIGKSVAPGLPAIFTSSTTGGLPLTYQWQLNGAALPGATNRNYTNLMVSLGDAGDYRVIAANPAGVATSQVAQLTLGSVAVWGTYVATHFVPLDPPPGLTNAVAIDGGLGYSVALNRDGTVTAWGESYATNVPPGLSGIVSIAAGLNHALALRSNGTVVAWGYNNVGQATVPSTLSNVVSIAAGGYRSSAVCRDGTVVAWGTGTNLPPDLHDVAACRISLIGKPSSFALKSDGTVAVWGGDPALAAPARLSNAMALVVGGVHAVALTESGTVISWGNTAITQVTNVPPNLTNVTAIAASPGGSDYRNGITYALQSNGVVRVWGLSSDGQTNVPPGLSNVVAIAGAYSHALALVNDGRPLLLQLPVGGTFYTGQELRLAAKAAGSEPLTFQWFRNGTPVAGGTNETHLIPNAQLDDAGTYQMVVSNSLGVAQSIPVPVTLVDGAPQITWQSPSGFAYHGSPLRLSATVIGSGPLNYQWFHNGLSIAGGSDELLFDRTLPEQGGGYWLIASNASGAVTSSVAQLTFSRVALWGSGYSLSNAPFDPGAISSFTLGYGAPMAVKPDGTVVVWSSSASLTNFALGVSNVTAVASGAAGCCAALRTDGTLVVWGTNNYGQLNIPAGATNLTAVSAGLNHLLALRADGKVFAWGYNGNGQTSIPGGLSNVVAISAGQWHSLALKADGTAVAWGLSAYTPPEATNIVAIAAGFQQCMGLRADGSLLTWMNLAQSQPTNVFTPIVIATGGAAPQNWGHSLALGPEGTLTGWGNNAYGQAAPPAGIFSAVQLSCGYVSSAAFLNDRSPVITVQPWDRRLMVGASVTLAAFAAGQPPLHYQWRRNGMDLPGATNNNLTLSAVSRVERGAYSMRVWNDLGSTNSRAAQVEVGGPLHLDSPALNADGQLSFRAADSSGAPLTPEDAASIAFQASTNLVEWTVIPGALSLSNGVIVVTDPMATNHPVRFYRLAE